MKLLRRFVSWIRPTSTSSSSEVGRPCLCVPMIVSRRTIGGAVAAFELVLEDQGRLAVGDPVGQRGDRELGQVQLVLPAGVLRRAAPPRPARSRPASSIGVSHSSWSITVSAFGVVMAVGLGVVSVFGPSERKTNNKTAAGCCCLLVSNKSLIQILCAARGW